MNTMRALIILCTFSACVTLVFCGTHPDGVSRVSREQDALGNYKFSYAVSNPEGEHFRNEETDHLGRVIGSYGLTHVDGTRRVVEYVADKDGFRAEVHSNEPGVISSESADPVISKIHSDPSLAMAATSLDKSAAGYGTRLTDDSSRVSYANQDKEKLLQPENLDDSPRETRQRNYEDYRPRNPVAYYPGTSIDKARSLPSSSQLDSNVPPKSQAQSPSDETRPLDVYLPPIDPNTAVRRPSYFVPRERLTDQSPYTSTSRRPFIPPYGGFDDDPVPVNRRPEISMSTIHGGLGRDEFESPLSATPSYGTGRYPSDDIPLSRDFINSRFPPTSHFPPLPRSPGGILSAPPRRVPGPIFRPPSRDTEFNPNFVLRAVPIPNGIQAVRVDPETGRVYDRLVYPLYLKDGQPVYDKNILLHNDEGNDDSGFRHHDSGYFDMPFQRRPPFRSVRNLAFDVNEDPGNLTRRFNRTFDPLALSIPTAKDLDWVRRQLSQVEGFDRARYPSPAILQNNQFENNEYPSFNDFDDSSYENPDTEARLYPPLRNTGYSDTSFSRDPRLFDRLTPEDTKEIVSKSESSNSDSESLASKPKVSVT